MTIDWNKRAAPWLRVEAETDAAHGPVLTELMRKAGNTSFGKDHSFDQINNPEEFAKNVPVRDYEALRSYVDRMVVGEEDEHRTNWKMDRRKSQTRIQPPVGFQSFVERNLPKLRMSKFHNLFNTILCNFCNFHKKDGRTDCLSDFLPFFLAN